MTKLLLVRHGKTVLSGAGKYYGKQDVKLSDEGIEQAHKLRAYLSRQHIDHVYTSSLSRAIDTAEIVVSGRGNKILHYEMLDEIDIGFLEGLTFAQVEEKYPELARVLLDWRLPAVFPGGESTVMFAERVGGFVSVLGEHKDDETVLVVAHGGSIRSLICHLLGLGSEYWMRLHIDFTSLSVVETFNGNSTLKALNDISHLKTQEAT